MTRLRELRKENGISQEKLGQIVNVSKVGISRYESGEREPPYTTLTKLADYFDVSIDYLLGRTDIKKVPSASAEGDKAYVLNVLRSLPEEGQKEALDYIRYLLTKYGVEPK